MKEICLWTLIGKSIVQNWCVVNDHEGGFYGQEKLKPLKILLKFQNLCSLSRFPKLLPWWFWSKHCRLCSWLTPMNKTESKTSPNKFPNQESGHSKNVQPKGNHWWCGFLLAGHSDRSHVHTPRSQGRCTFHWVLKKVHYYSHHPLNRGFTCYTKVHSSHFKDYCTLILP